MGSEPEVILPATGSGTNVTEASAVATHSTAYVPYFVILAELLYSTDVTFVFPHRGQD